MDIFVRNPYNYDVDAASLESGLDCSVVRDGEEVSRTQQSFAEECDINTIVRRFGLTGELPSNVRMPVNADFHELLDFKDAMNAIVAARESFDVMPANVRARFHNDPAEFVEFCSDDANRDEARKLGLLVPAAVAEAPAAAAAAPAAGAVSGSGVAAATS